MRLLIVFGSTEGHTHDVARRMAQLAEDAGHKAETLNAAALDSPLDPYWFDTVIVAGTAPVGRAGVRARK